MSDAGTNIPLEIGYTNHRGAWSVRRIVPLRIWFGVTAWHHEPQWLLEAFDLDKQANRDFAICDFGQDVNGGLVAMLEAKRALQDIGPTPTHDKAGDRFRLMQGVDKAGRILGAAISKLTKGS